MVMVSAVIVGGCSDPLEGRWQGETLFSCFPGQDSVDFTVYGDDSGDGQVCNCQFVFVVEERGKDRYLFDVDFRSSACGLFGDGLYECFLSRDDTFLDCDNAIGDYYKID